MELPSWIEELPTASGYWKSERLACLPGWVRGLNIYRYSLSEYYLTLCASLSVYQTLLLHPTLMHGVLPPALLNA